MYHVTLLILTFTSSVLADYDCACNFNVEESVFANPGLSGPPIGYMYEFDCKPVYSDPAPSGPIPIQFEKTLGYVKPGPQLKLQTCPGDPSKDDLILSTTKMPSTTAMRTSAATKPIVTTTTTRKPIVTTTTTRKPIVTTTTTTPKSTTKTTTTTTTTPNPTTTSTTTTPKPTTTSTTTPKPTTTSTTTTPKPTTTSTTTPKPTTTSTTTPKPTTTSTTTPKPTTTSTTTTPKPTTAAITEGRIDLCPKYITTDAIRNGGFIGQFGRFCYELVDTPTQWGIAERHCKLASSGHLLYIMNQDEQDYIQRLLSAHQYIHPLWTGLTDNINEGHWVWSAGVEVSYTNFGRNYTSHSSINHQLNDCVVMNPKSGMWTDLPCGVTLVAGIGLFDKHSYVCKHQINSTVFDLISHPGEALIG